MESFSQDPIGFNAGDANLYRYVGNHPTMATDPSGLKETWPMEKIIEKIRSDSKLTQKQKDWKINELARGCVGLTSVTVGYTEQGYAPFKKSYEDPLDAKKEMDRLRKLGSTNVLVFSVHFYNPDPLVKNPDGTVDMGQSFDPSRHRPPWRDTDGDGDIDQDDDWGVNFDFGVRRPTPYGMKIVHADMYHNPDDDGDGVGDFYPKNKIRKSTVYISSIDEWRKSYADFNKEVWVVVEADPDRCESK